MVANIGVTHPEYIMVTRGVSSRTQDNHLGSKEEAEVVVVEGDAPAPGSANEEGGGEASTGVGTSQEQLAGGVEGKEGGLKEEGGGEDEKGREKRQNGNIVRTMKENGAVEKGGVESDIGRKTKEKGGVEKGGVESSASEELLQPTIQALAVLSNVRCPVQQIFLHCGKNNA